MCQTILTVLSGLQSSLPLTLFKFWKEHTGYSSLSYTSVSWFTCIFLASISWISQILTICSCLDSPHLDLHLIRALCIYNQMNHFRHKVYFFHSDCVLRYELCETPSCTAVQRTPAAANLLLSWLHCCCTQARTVLVVRL